MSRRLTLASLIAYGIMAIATFGHAAADEPLRCPEAARYCLDSDMQGRAVISSMVAGAVWPLYWSWEAWS